MTALREDAVVERVVSQGRIMEALAEDEAPLTGMLARLGHQFKLAPDELRTCLLELACAGWITVLIQPFGRLTIQLAREEGAHPVTMAGCRSVPDVWRL
jgi:hypothetical protein